MKLVENLKAIDTGQRRHIMEPFYSIDYKSENVEIALGSHAREYSIRVTLGANQWIDEHQIKQSDGKVIEYAIDEMKHIILEEVYGEFRRDLHELKFLLGNELSYRNSPTVEKLNEILNKITL